MSIRVKVEDNNIERALQRFKKKVKESGIFLDMRKTEEYTKPSEQRRSAKKLGTRRAKIRIRQENM